MIDRHLSDNLHVYCRVDKKLLINIDKIKLNDKIRISKKQEKWTKKKTDFAVFDFSLFLFFKEIEPI